MLLSRNSIYGIAAGSVAVVAAVAISYQVWRGGPPQARGQIPRSLGAAAPAAAPSAAPMRAPAAPAAPTPSFDIVRVEPTGEAVVAGRAAPHATVELLDNGKPAGTVQADDSGQFALTPSLGVGSHDLSLSTKGPAVVSRQSVTVVVPKGPGDRLVVALTEPGRPTRVLADSPAQAAAAPAALGASGGQVFVRTVEAGQGGDFFASGTAAPDAPIRLYLNDSPIASTQADRTGAWSVRVARRIAPGSYRVRVDQLDRRTAAVAARAETKFDFAGFREASARAKAELPAAAKIKVSRGESLWVISRRIFGRGTRYTLIYDANSEQIRDRNLIYPGQVFVLPKS